MAFKRLTNWGEKVSLKDKFDLKYFLGDKFLSEGKIIEVLSIDWDDENGNYYEVGEYGWVGDSFLDSQYLLKKGLVAMNNGEVVNQLKQYDDELQVVIEKSNGVQLSTIDKIKMVNGIVHIVESE